MKNEVVASENDWTGLTSYYRDEEGNRFAVGIHDLRREIILRNLDFHH